MGIDDQLMSMLCSPLLPPISLGEISQQVCANPQLHIGYDRWQMSALTYIEIVISTTLALVGLLKSVILLDEHHELTSLPIVQIAKATGSW